MSEKTSLFGKNTNIEKLVVLSLFIPEVRSKIGGYIESWFFENEILRKTASVLVKEKFMNRAVNKTIFLLTLKSEFPETTDEEIEIISELMEESKPLLELDEKEILSCVSNFIKDAYRAKASQLYSEGEGEKGDYFSSKAMSFGVEEEIIMDPSNLEEVFKAKKEDIPVDGEEIKSSLECINSSLLYNGYKSGDLVMVCAAPKSGKTSFLIQEGTNFLRRGFKVLHIMIGDMSNFDSVVRYLSCLTTTPQRDVIRNVENLVPSNKEILSNLRIGSIPALSRTVFEILSEAKRLKNSFDYKVLILDYDANILVPRTESLYESGGILYSTLKGFAQKEKVLVFIASQPKIQYWEEEILGGATAAESSRKQAAVDLMITLGRNKKCRKVGTLHIPYTRRGESGIIKRVKFDDEVCRVSEIENDLYKRMIENYIEETSTDDLYVELLLSDASSKNREGSGKSRQRKGEIE